MIGHNTILEHDKRVVLRNILDETILVPICGNIADMQRLYVLSPVAEFVWNHIDGNRSFKEIVDIVTAIYDVDESAAAEDIEELVNRLTGFGMIRKKK
jgi:hypothetical protein